MTILSSPIGADYRPATAAAVTVLTDAGVPVHLPGTEAYAALTGTSNLTKAIQPVARRPRARPRGRQPHGPRGGLGGAAGRGPEHRPRRDRDHAGRDPGQHRRPRRAHGARRRALGAHRRRRAVGGRPRGVRAARARRAGRLVARRRRRRLPDRAAGSARSPAPTGSRPTPSARSRSSPATASPAASPRRTTRSCSGACAAARARSGIVTAVEIDLVEQAELYAGALWFAGADAVRRGPHVEPVVRRAARGGHHVDRRDAPARPADVPRAAARHDVGRRAVRVDG